MRKLFIALLALGATHAHSQVSNAFKDEMESIFQYVNRSPVTTGLLADYGIYFTNIEKYNGIPSDSSYVDYAEWQSLYNSLYSCRFNSNASLQAPGTLYHSADSVAGLYEGITVIAALHYNYQQFKPNAVPSMVYVSNNKIYDTPGRTQSPYEAKDAFAVTPLSQVFEGAVQKFILKSEMVLLNTGKNVHMFLIDFGNGAGFQNVSANEVMPIIYDTEGEKIMRFKVIYTDSTIRESHSKIMVTNVEQANPQARYGGVNISTFNFPISGFPFPKAYQGKAGKALVTIEYASPDKILRKPLIVVEGFDPWKIIDPGNTSANYSFSDFISSNGVLGRGIYVPINYTHNGVFYSTLSDALEGEDFDLVFIDFDDGTDYIQRNAYLVENIIQWVNANKQPYAGVMQKNAVIGFSMGGLVARYALRDMELSSPVINHDTRLYMSFDSPHQGANIPLGFQATVSHLNGVGVGFGLPGIYYNPSSLQLGNLNPDLGRAFKLLNSPAARQMLYYSITGSGNLLINDNSAHTAFMADYTSKGYPLQGGIRNVVIANGSECGVDQGFQPHAQFVNFNKKISMKGFVKYVVAGLAGAVTNYPQALVQLIPGKSNIYMQFTINALPNQSNQRVYRGRVYIKKKILWLINSTVDIFDKSFNAPASYLPLDNYGGGVNDISSIAGSLPFPVNITRFSFVPTFSALDIGNGLQPITLNDLQRVYSPASPPAAPKNVIAANFFSNPSEQEGPANELHTQITLRNGRWMFEEIVGIPAFFSCSINCVGTGLESVISGASIICSSQVYKINNLPPGATVTWSSTWNSPPYPTLVHNSPNTNELTINNTYGYPSTTTLTATITGLCGSVVLTKQIMSETNTLVQHGNYTQQACYVNGLQQPALSGSLSTTGSATYLHQLCVAEITLTQMTGKTISVPYSQPMYWAYNSTNSKLTLQLPVGSGGVPFTFKISGEGACQEKTLVFFSYLTYYNKYAFSISPNPANSEYLTILAEPSEELLRQKSAQDASEGLEYTVSIIDLTTAETICSPVNFKGRLKQQLNITTLPQGLYNLRISAGDDTQTIRFLKQ